MSALGARRMSSITPDEGLDAIIDSLAIQEPSPDMTQMAVGTGTSTPTSTDTSLENETFRATTSDSVVTIEPTSSTGEMRCEITVSGGTEIPAGTEITEIGIYFDENSLVHREVRSAVTVNAGDRKTFTTTFAVNNA